MLNERISVISPVPTTTCILPVEVQHLLCTFLNLKVLLKLRASSRYWFCLVTGYLLQQHAFCFGAVKWSKAYPCLIKNASVCDITNEELTSFAGVDNIQIRVQTALSERGLQNLSRCSSVALFFGDVDVTFGISLLENVRTIELEGFDGEVLQHFPRATTVNLTEMILDATALLPLCKVENLSLHICRLAKATVFPSDLRSLKLFFCTTPALRMLSGSLLHELPYLELFYACYSIKLTDDDLAHLPLLKVLHLHQCNSITDRVICKLRLDELVLSNMDCRPYDFAPLSRVRHLDLSSSLFSQAALLHFANLYSLNLANTDVTDECLKLLRQRMGRSPHTVNLLACHLITNEGLRYLSGVQDLNLFNCGVDDAGLEFVCGVHTITLCRLITDIGLSWMRGVLWLNIAECENVTDNGLHHVCGADYVFLPSKAVGITSHALNILCESRLEPSSFVDLLRKKNTKPILSVH